MSANPPLPPIAASRWLTTRRALVLGALAVAATTAIVGLHRSSNRRFLENVAEALPESATMSADLLSEWFRWRLGGFDSDQAVVVREVTVRAAEGADSTRVLRLRATRANGSEITVDLPARETTFPRFNVAASDDRTQRTALIVRGAQGDQLALVSAPGGGPRPAEGGASVPAGASVPDAVRDAINAANGQRVHGVSAGLFGQRVVWAAAPVPGTSLWLLRQRDAQELLDLLRPQLFFSDAVFAALALLVLGLLAYRWRAVTMAAERDAVRLRAAFVSSVSHELRTPLTQIRMYAEMLRLGFLQDEAEADRALHVIEREAGRLGLLVDRALTYARTGAQPPSPSGRAMLGETVGRAVAAMQPLLVERNTTVAVDMPEDWAVQGDADSLQQVLINLLDNALKYGPPGQTIRLSATRDGRVTRLAVDDEGPGVPQEDRDRIWTAFVRGTHEREISGSGIGLAIVRDIVRAAGGSAAVTERPDGHGARFVVSLPTA
ncbi:MAG: HAMP domain-containing sensor histidine kinase [Gemmatimonadaceae bacterium]|nr:HAMP domain-containing sensor histidine kinase [Gemmatimonadaceae bacterium]